MRIRSPCWVKVTLCTSSAVATVVLRTWGGVSDIAEAVWATAASRSNATTSPRASGAARCTSVDVLARNLPAFSSNASDSRRVSQQDHASALAGLTAARMRSSAVL